jgi:ketose-bisphosphate aldolase
MRIQEKLVQLKKDKKAILATNFYNLETLKGILHASKEADLPVILQLSKSSIEYMGLKMAVTMARQGLKDYQVEGWLHLDHGDSPELVKKCLEAGFDSVMIDASEKSFDENVKVTSQVVEMAKKFHANVEAELGFVAKLGQNQAGAFTSPEEAKRFVELTGVNALAIAIGSAHGFYTEKPNLRINILQQIEQITPAVLVLHGSSGIPVPMLKDAVKHGITKINLATEIKDAFMKALKAHLMQSDEIDLRKVFPVGINAVTDLVREKLLSLHEEKSVSI